MPSRPTQDVKIPTKWGVLWFKFTGVKTHTKQPPHKQCACRQCSETNICNYYTSRGFMLV